MSKTMNTRTFRVEGHGASELQMIGGTTRPGAFRPDPLLTREGAWSAVKSLVAGGRYHTIKVYNGGDVVFRAWRQSDGTYIDSNTCKTVAA